MKEPNQSPEPSDETSESVEVAIPEYDAKFTIGGWCPVQAFGSVRGRELYFRARHDEWSFEIADRSGKLPSDGSTESDYFFRRGDWPKSGKMPKKQAIELIRVCLSEYAQNAQPVARANGRSSPLTLGESMVPTTIARIEGLESDALAETYARMRAALGEKIEGGYVPRWGPEDGGAWLITGDFKLVLSFLRERPDLKKKSVFDVYYVGTMTPQDLALITDALPESDISKRR